MLFFPDSQRILIQNTSNRRNGKVATGCQFQEVLCLALSEWCDPCLGASLGLLKHARKISVPVSLFQSNCEKWQKHVKSVLLAEGNVEQGNMEAERMRQTIFIVMSGGVWNIHYIPFVFLESIVSISEATNIEQEHDRKK